LTPEQLALVKSIAKRFAEVDAMPDDERQKIIDKSKRLYKRWDSVPFGELD